LLEKINSHAVQFVAECFSHPEVYDYVDKLDISHLDMHILSPDYQDLG